jgi:hypothetical protein
MKTRTFIFMSIFLLAVTFLFAEDVKKEISDEEAVEMLSGTWINPDNPSSASIDKLQAHFQKLVLTENKVFECYHSVDDTLDFSRGHYTVINSWVDRKGNTYCQAKWLFVTGSMIYALYKLDDSNTVLEQNFYYTRSIWDEEKYPTEIITHDVIVEDNSFWSYDNRYYNIFYRQ